MHCGVPVRVDDKQQKMTNRILLSTVYFKVNFGGIKRLASTYF